MADHSSQNPTTEPTVIGAACRIAGDLTMEGDAVVLGSIEGTLEATGAVHIGPGAEVRGGVCGTSVEIDGRVDGDVAAEGPVQLKGRIEGDVYAGAAFEMHAEAALIGDLYAATISVSEGATYRGHVVIGPDAAAEAQVQRQTQQEDDGGHPVAEAPRRGREHHDPRRDEAATVGRVAPGESAADGGESESPVGEPQTDANGANGLLRRRSGLLSRSGSVRA